MDPLSITAGIIAVAGVAATTGSAFSDLRQSCKTLPGRLHALSNEVTDIELVLYQVAATITKRQEIPVLHTEVANIQHLLRHAQNKLEELRAVVERLTKFCRSTKVTILGARAWRKDQPRLQSLQEDIKNIKCSLNIMLGASNS